MKRFWISTALLFAFTFILGSIFTFLFENKIYDQKIRALSHPTPAPIILVEIDQESIDFYSKNFNIPWPWPRSLYARAIDFLTAAGVKAIGLDMIFSEASPFGSDEDEKLAAAIQRSDRTFMPLLFSSLDTGVIDIARFALKSEPGLCRLPVRSGIKSVPVPQIFAALQGSGNAFFALDRDSVFRRMQHFIRFRGHVYPSFSLALALFAEPKMPTQQIPFAEDGGLNLKFYSRDSFQRFSISGLIQSQVRLEQGQQAVIPLTIFKNKIVLIGATAPGLLDNRPTPVSTRGAGFELHATALANLLERDFIRVLDPRLQWLLVLLIIAAFNHFLARIKSMRAQLLAASGVILLVAAGNLILFYLGMDQNFLPLFTGLIACAAHDVYQRYQHERRKKKIIQNAFKNYMSDSLLAEIMKNPDALKLGGEKKLVTIFFSDLAGFTSISEAMPPEEVVRILNLYLEKMTTVILENGGYIDKYEGDAVMAFWGAPLPSVGQAVQAMRAALGCREELLALNLDFAKKGLPPLGMRIGINSGEVIVGNIGSTKKIGYTVIGDAVNLASRLEGINKQYRTAIICGSLAGSMAAGEMVLRRLDRVRVKGKKIPEEIFEVVCEKEQAPAGLLKIHADFEKGLQLYFAGDFSAALEAFMALADDPPAQVFAKRCLHLLDNPPADWDGCWTFTEK